MNKTLLLLVWNVHFLLAQPTKMAFIKAGDFTPLYTAIPRQVIHIGSFQMDITPVTNKQYADFIQKNPSWNKRQASHLFTDSSYLSSWDAKNNFVQKYPNAPVTNVSWFAAKAYCECQGKRLPTTNEWEYVAMASNTKKDARKDSSYTKLILKAYEKRNSAFFSVGQSKPNIWGVFNLNELVWEWTQDFNAVFFSDEGKNYCGSGSLTANDLNDYPAFIRYAYRDGLKANFCVKSLGFRCVK